MKVIIAEKPSVAKNIAEALNIKNRKDGYFVGPGYYITWAFGHLVQLYDAKDYDPKMSTWRMENFPFIPSNFKYKVKSSSSDRNKVDDGSSKQINIIKHLISKDDVDMVISACDRDREGELISWLLIQFLQVKKPVYRLLLNEWTPEEVLKGLEEIIPIVEMKPLRDAGISRQWADWVIGINLTSVATLKYQKGSGQPLNIGRVLLPTLKIIYDRCKEIENFKPNDYFKLSAVFETISGDEYLGTYIIEDSDTKDKFYNKSELENILNKIQDKDATIIGKEVDLKKENPPFLFNLSNLQGHITSKYNGWSSDKVLKVCQSLYEKKFITYPRTASIVLEESLVDKTQKVLNTLKTGLPYEPEIKFKKTKRIFDNSKVDSHSAITPTYIIPKGLRSDEQIVYDAIKNRFIMQFMPSSEYEETKLTTKINNVELDGLFISRGKIQKVEGWKKVEKVNNKDTFLPNVSINDIVNVNKCEVTTHTTTPPKLHTEKTLLRVMETCGRKVDDEEIVLNGFSIGTPATRAETIKKLKTVGYIQSKGKSLTSTDLGNKLVETFPIKELFDLEYTGKLEKNLYDIEKSKIDKNTFLSMIFDFTKASVNAIKDDNDVVINLLPSKFDDKPLEILGNCPLCNSPIIEGKKGFGCSNWKSGCKFVIWKEDNYLKAFGKKPTKTMVKKLLKDGIVEVKGLKSKNGNKFDALFRYEKNPDNDYFSWKLEFCNNKITNNTTNASTNTKSKTVPTN
ncbi:type IA DNA topoisomerase [Terrisporobacter sp.]|uniref:type IA DNA topoisomerase n=1 Tax=Terrisporobacter sp. TaxID=1965305 RepID=UPI002621E1AA|nr:type IA DNA topoisomerase [Terrisporobacter sp.]